jgi:hypothetical protein
VERLSEDSTRRRTRNMASARRVLLERGGFGRRKRGIDRLDDLLRATEPPLEAGAERIDVGGHVVEVIGFELQALVFGNGVKAASKIGFNATPVHGSRQIKGTAEGFRVHLRPADGAINERVLVNDNASATAGRPAFRINIGAGEVETAKAVFAPGTYNQGRIAKVEITARRPGNARAFGAQHIFDVGGIPASQRADVAAGEGTSFGAGGGRIEPGEGEGRRQ